MKLSQNFIQYINKLGEVAGCSNLDSLDELFLDLQKARDKRNQVFICGNGGSGGNAIHIANDWFYGIKNQKNPGLRVHALTANQSITTCLANDEGYENVFSLQLENLAEVDDILIVLSGSGNSPNIVKALEVSKKMGMSSYAILGFDGGKAKALAKHCIHFEIDDMQIAEDLQMVIGHSLMQRLYDF